MVLLKLSKVGKIIVALLGAAAAAATIYQAVISPLSAQPTQPSLSGASGNFNFNQQGGTVNQTYVNQAPPKLKFTEALGAEVVAKLPRDKPIRVAAVGSKADQAVGVEFANFLQSRGYTVTLALIGIMGPPPDHPLTWDADASQLIVAPGVN